MHSHLSRRQFLTALAAAGGASLSGCGPPTANSPIPGGGSARFTARPKAPTIDAARGTTFISANPLDGALLVPSSYDGVTPMPLVLALHGAGGTAQGQINLLGGLAESRGFLLLAVGARGLTWDVFTYKYSYDVTFIDSALAWAFDRVVVDASRIVVEGFSDGASYALGLALANGDLFTRAVSFSPGYIPASDSPLVGKPRFFESAGVQDEVLPIDRASRAIVPALKSHGYDVTYVEFQGGHEVPTAIASQAADFIMA